MPHTSDAIRPQHSLRLRILAATLLLSLGGLGFAGLTLLETNDARYNAQVLADVSAASSMMTLGNIELSLERSVSQVAIALPGAINPTLRGMIDEQRRKADAALQQSAALSIVLPAGATERSALFRTEMNSLLAKLAPIRASVDRLSALPQAQRDAPLVGALPHDLKAVVADIQALRHLLRGPGLPMPTEIAMLEAVRDLAWQIREYGGRERTYMVIAAANGTAIEPAVLAEMKMLAQHAADAWGEIGRIAAHPGMPAAVQSALRTVQDGYFGNYASLRMAMLAEGSKATPAYPADFQGFFARSATALGEVETLAGSVSSAVGSFWTARIARDTRYAILDAVAAVLMAIAGGVSILLVVRAFGRLDGMRRRMRGLAEGDVDTEVPDAAARDEVGAMARAVQVFRETAVERRTLEAAERRTQGAAAVREQAEKDRKQAAMARHVSDFTESMTGVMRGLSSSAARMDESSQTMATAAGRTGNLARATTEGAQSSARDLVTVASATEELSAAVNEISSQVSSAAATAQGMAAKASDTEQAMAGLAQAAERIGEVARLIGDIAGQTNLLALNATIEAARAGDAGKGFAVVASEVKQLATRTAAATGEIASQIGAIQGATGGAVNAVRQMATEVRQMEEMAAAIAAAVEQQGAGVRDIAGSIAKVTMATESAVEAMGEAAGAAEDAQRISANVREAAAEVGREAALLGQELTQFQTAMLSAAA